MLCDFLGPEVNLDSWFCRRWEPNPVKAESMHVFSV